MLIAMGTPSNILDLSALYLKIYFYSIPAFMVYNFGASIFRAMGDSRRPMFFLAVTGVLHIGLSLLFVPVFRLGVRGVALSTVISTYCSAFLLISFLSRSDRKIRFELRKMRIDPENLRNILRIGVPAGIQSLLFSISNVMVQSSVNSFGSAMVAGNSASGNIESYLATSMIAYYNAALTFTSQSIGAKRYDRIGPIAKPVLALVSAICLFFGGLAILFRVPLLSIYTKDQSVIPLGSMRMTILMSAYFVNGIMNVTPGLSRAMGYSISSMLCTLVGACLLRIVWLNTVFIWYHTEIMLFMCYPVTWALAGFGQIAIYLYARSKLLKSSSVQNHAEEPVAVSETM
jgi:putative MATE family efflux protein